MKRPFFITRGRWLLSWLTVRPRRWFFGNMLWQGSFESRWLPKRREEWDSYHYGKDRHRTDLEMIQWPNVHWVFLYRTVWRFFRWLNWTAWGKLCRVENGRYKSVPWYAKAVRWIGKFAVGYHIFGGECFHCASKHGNQGDLADDETGATFILEDSGTTATMDGTDHWWCGTTICPKCGHRQFYRDSSL